MRIALCVRHSQAIYRLAWLNESKDGIYVGALGGAEDAHLSYHKDGTQHMKMGEGYHNRDKCTPITAHVGFKHLGHFSLSLTKGWFNKKRPTRAMDKRNPLFSLMNAYSYGWTHWRWTFGLRIVRPNMNFLEPSRLTSAWTTNFRL